MQLPKIWMKFGFTTGQIDFCKNIILPFLAVISQYLCAFLTILQGHHPVKHQIFGEFRPAIPFVFIAQRWEEQINRPPPQVE
jgi:hypothetical protein